MPVTQRVKNILDWYESDNPGTKANLAGIRMEGANSTAPERSWMAGIRRP